MLLKIDYAKYLIFKGASVSPMCAESAIITGDLEFISYILSKIDQGSQVDITELLNNMLSRAVSSQKTDVIEYLISKGGNISSLKCLGAAVITGDLDYIDYIFNKANQDLKTGDSKLLDDLLLPAIQSRQLEVVKYLIDKGANINGVGGNIPIINAIGTGDLNLVEFFVESEASLNGTLESSIMSNNQTIANYLREKGATINFERAGFVVDLAVEWIQNLVINCGYPYANFVKACNDDHSIESIYQTVKELLKLPDAKGTNSFKMITRFLGIKGGEELKQKIINENSPSDVTKYFNLLQLKHTFKNDKFVLTTQIYGDESASCPENIKERCKISVKDQKLYNKGSDELLNYTDGALYVVDKHGTLFVAPPTEFRNVNHSFFLKGTDGKTKLGDISLYGYGKPVACGGHLKVKDGVITEINNRSGHYTPDANQLLLVFKHFLDLGVVAEGVKIVSHNQDSIDSSIVETLNIGEILDLYPSM